MKDYKGHGPCVSCLPPAVSASSPVLTSWILGDNLGLHTVDARAVYQSGLIDFLEARTPKSVTQFLESYKNSRSLCQYSLLKEVSTMDEVVAMISFHFSIVISLTKSYASWALSNLATETKKEPSGSHDKILSRTEKTRLVRALYHFQIYCNLFGVSRCCNSRKRLRWNFNDDKSIFKIFLCIYEPGRLRRLPASTLLLERS